jgi:hypothetical protein
MDSSSIGDVVRVSAPWVFSWVPSEEMYGEEGPRIDANALGIF